MPDNDVKQILQDDMDFIWVATAHGLTRFDGLNFKKYNHNMNEPDSISDNDVKSILQDDSGTLWVGTSNGLNRLKHHQTGFINYFQEIDNIQSLTNSHVTVINQDGAGRIWIGSKSGVNLVIGKQADSFKRYLYNVKTAPTIVNFIQPINSSVLVGTNKGLHKYSETSDDFTLIETTLPELNSTANFVAAFVDSKDNLWLSVDKQGVYVKYKDEPDFTHFQYLNLDFNDESVTAFSEDENGNIWIGSTLSGLFLYDKEIKAVSSIRRIEKSQGFNALFSDIQSFLRDKSGLMWIGTAASGIYQWNPNTLNIQHFDNRDFDEHSSIDAKNIWHFAEDNHGILWIATREGVKSYSSQTKTFNSISIKTDSEEEEPEVFFITVEDNNLWFAAETSLIRYTPGVGVTERIVSSSQEGFYLPDDVSVYAIQYLDGILYAAIGDHGLLAFDLTAKQLTEIPIQSEKNNSLSTTHPVTLKLSSDNSLWVLTKDGLYNYSPEQKLFRLAIDEGPDKLSYSRVSALYEETPNSIWVGTSGNGVNHLIIDDYDNGTYRIEQFNHIDELKNQIINGLLLDDAVPANLWISTHSGLFNFNTETHALRQFTPEDGLQGREFNEGTYFKGTDGYLYFGGTNGFNRLEPIKFSSSKYEPPLRISKLSIDCFEDVFPCNESLSVKDVNLNCKLNNNNCFKENADILHLPANVQKIELSFVSLDYTNPKKNNYRYRLYSNIKSPWIDLHGENTLLFDRVQSNSYTLEIQGSNHAGLWSSQVTTFKFTIDTPWYKSDYSYLAMALIFFFTIYLFSTKQALKRQKERGIRLAIERSEENFKFALWGTGDELWEWDITNDEFKRTNPIKIIDDSPNNYDGKLSSVGALIHPEEIDDVRKSFNAHLIGDSPHFEAFFRIKSKNGGYIWTLARARVVDRDNDGKPLRLLGSIKDITIIKATEDKLNLIAKAFETTMGGISILDPTFKSVLNNQAFYKITGLSLVEAINKHYFFSEQSLNHKQYQQVKIALKNFGEWEGEIWEQRDNGEKFAIDLKIDGVRNANRQITHYICVFSDITFRKIAEGELRRLANVDSLTGLPNRSLFMDRLSHALAFAKRNKTQFALLFIDLDHFKNINDSLGHSIGDALLQKVAKRLHRCIRDIDTIARLGGDEFTIILENIKNADEAGVCADKIIKRMMKSIDISGMILKTSPSIGIGMYPSDGSDCESLLKNADLAMYSAKEKGRNNYQFFTSDMTSSAVERISIESKLRVAIEQKQLELYYQPKVYSQTGELTGFEALIRWIHPDKGIISPAAFIPVAEETGLILEMGDWILEDAINQAKQWSEINPNCCSIAINISARQFQQGKLAKQVAKLLMKYDLLPQYIELEITEGTLMSNMEHAITTLKTLSDMGVSLSLDDFGTGYSSLSYLKQFPVDKLKVDQSFVRDIMVNPGDASIVASIINLAHNLGLTVIAEGCETVEQLQFINSYDCEEVQGYLFSRPLPRVEAELILRQGCITIEDDSTI
ncbi:MAG: EAL domain-containing protein [Gammaproteobacteria bacterium]|nr:EAL domain-containing protein [Gammaproteobacteria bacterium]